MMDAHPLLQGRDKLEGRADLGAQEVLNKPDNRRHWVEIRQALRGLCRHFPHSGNVVCDSDTRATGRHDRRHCRRLETQAVLSTLGDDAALGYIDGPHPTNAVRATKRHGLRRRGQGLETEMPAGALAVVRRSAIEPDNPFVGLPRHGAEADGPARTDILRQPPRNRFGPLRHRA